MLGRWLPVVVVAVAVAAAGCGFVPQEPAHAIDFDGTVERSDGTFRMDGQVEVDAGAAPTRNFTDVSVVLYGAPGEVLERVHLGTMSTDSSVAPKRRPIDVVRDLSPEYVVVESPDFWDGGRTAVVAFRWNGERYEEYRVESRDERFDG